MWAENHISLLSLFLYLFIIYVFVYLFHYLFSCIYLFTGYMERKRGERSLSLSFSFSPPLSLFLPLSLSFSLAFLPSFLPGLLACFLSFFLPSFFFDFCLSFSLRLALHPCLSFYLTQVVLLLQWLCLSSHGCPCSLVTLSSASQTRDGPWKTFESQAPKKRGLSYMNELCLNRKDLPPPSFVLPAGRSPSHPQARFARSQPCRQEKTTLCEDTRNQTNRCPFAIAAPFVLASSTLARCQQLRHQLRVHVGLFSRFP